jgi:hypothetical protein
VGGGAEGEEHLGLAAPVSQVKARVTPRLKRGQASFRTSIVMEFAVMPRCRQETYFTRINQSDSIG